MVDIMAVNDDAYERIEVRHAHPNERGSWLAIIRHPAVPGRRVAAKQHLNLTFEELVALGEHIAEVVESRGTI